MTVGELIGQLAVLDPNLPVVIHSYHTGSEYILAQAVEIVEACRNEDESEWDKPFDGSDCTQRLALIP